MAIAKGELITAADIVAYNTTYTIVKPKLAVSANFNETNTETSEEDFWLRNNLTSNWRGRGTIGSYSLGTITWEIKDSGGTVVYTDTWSDAGGTSGKDRDVSTTLTPGKYSLKLTVQTIGDPPFRTVRNEAYWSYYPSDVVIAQGDAVKMFNEEFSDLAEDQELTATVANAGRFTSPNFLGGT